MTATRIGDYQVEKELGSGTAGVVYRAVHVETGQPFAVKLLSPEMSREEVMQRRFVREMAVMSKLQHENIVRYAEGGLHEDRFFFAMELVACDSLKQVLAVRGALTWQEAAECAGQVCLALQCAHEQGVIHRDLKPANIFLSSDGLLKLGDFGLARDLGAARLTTAGLTVGTCRYMSPEQIEGHDELTGATDLYALGCLLFELVTGKVPFDGGTVFEILDQHHQAAPPHAKVFAPDCPVELAELIESLLAKKPAERPTSAADVKARLDAVLAAHQSADVGETATDNGNLADRLRSGPSTTAREVAWKPLLLIAAVIVVAIIVAAMLPGR